MIIRKLNFLKDWGVEIDCACAFAEFNPLWEPAFNAILAPYSLAIKLGRIPHIRGLKIEAELYSEAVIMGSPTPEFTAFTKVQWAAWLVKNEDCFDVMQSICEHRVNFDPNAEVPADGNDAAAGNQHEKAGQTSPETG